MDDKEIVALRAIYTYASNVGTTSGAQTAPARPSQSDFEVVADILRRAGEDA